MYVHANVMPIMVTETMGSLYYSTVMDGIIFMWTSGSYPVAAVIFIASVFVPVFKIAVLTWPGIQDSCAYLAVHLGEEAQFPQKAVSQEENQALPRH